MKQMRVKHSMCTGLWHCVRKLRAGIQRLGRGYAHLGVADSSIDRMQSHTIFDMVRAVVEVVVMLMEARTINVRAEYFRKNTVNR